MDFSRQGLAQVDGALNYITNLFVFILMFSILFMLLCQYLYQNLYHITYHNLNRQMFIRVFLYIKRVRVLFSLNIFKIYGK